MHLRPAGVADIPAILPMMIDFNRSEAIDWDPGPGQRALRDLLEHPEVGRLLLIDDGGVQGYLLLTFGFDLEFGGRYAFLTEVFVRPQARRRGLGRRALAELDQHARAAGVHAVHLAVNPHNAPALALYRAAGYVASPRTLMTRQLAG